MANPLYLVADVGGTNTRVGLADDHGVHQSSIRRYANKEHADLAPVLRSYRDDMGITELAGACVAAAGPVENGRAELTNLHWSIDEAELRSATGAASGAILNDLQAQGHALSVLPQASTPVLLEGPKTAHHPKLVIGVGTGFNIAPVYPAPTGHIIPPSESGHAILPMRTEADLRLKEFIAPGDEFPAIEDILSGRGVERVYKWLAHEAGTAADWPAAEIMKRIETDKIASDTVRTVVRILGMVAGNLSLIHVPFGGVYLAGGVSRAMAPHLDAMGFADAFRDKGRFSEFMNGFPVYLIDDDFAALTGCAVYLKTQAFQLTEN